MCDVYTCFLASSSERERGVGRISEKYCSLADLSGCCACSNRGSARDVKNYVIPWWRATRNYWSTGAATETASMVLTCCVVDCHRRGGHDKVSFFRIPSATDTKGKN